MKFASIDIETTGLDSETCQTLSIGIVLENTKTKLPFVDVPTLHIIVLHDYIQGEPYALNLNKGIIEKILNHQQKEKSAGHFISNSYDSCVFLRPEAVAEYIHLFLKMYGFADGKLNVAGKNFSDFDKPFLEKLPDWKKFIKTHRRVLDPAVLFVDWEEDEVLPDLNLCKSRIANYENVSHDALEDAWDVVTLFRTKY